MFVIPAFLSITLDLTLVIVYFRQADLYGREKHTQPWAHLFDISACDFDLAALAILRVLFLCPYIFSYVHRRRIVYAFLPWAWEALNMGLVTARLVFLVSALVGFDAQYFLVAVSFASIILQAVCLEHLRSSAPREKRIFLASSLNRVDASTRLLDPALQHHQHQPYPQHYQQQQLLLSQQQHPQQQQQQQPGELYDGHQEDVDFIATITAKMKRAKEYWTGKTETLRVLWNDLSRNREEETSPFNLLLRLFTYEDVLGEMDEAFAHDPASIEFYIPQLVTFLLYGAFWSSGSLQAFLLDKCTRSVQFAHRLYWFLQASCLDGSGINMEGVRQVAALIEDVKARGQKAAQRVEEGRTTQELHPHSGNGNNGGHHSDHHHHHHHHHHPHQNYQRWGRDSRDSQLSKDREGGTSSLIYGGGGGGGGGYYSSSSSCNTHTTSTARDSGTGQSTYIDIGQLPPSISTEGHTHTHTHDGPGSGGSAPASPTTTAPQRFPFDQGAYRGLDGDLFDVLPRFIDSLITVSRDLMPISRDKRNATLRSGLQELGNRFLPSNVIYMPVGNAYHRVWRIHAAESFSFSTKERVPCLICLEVVDYWRPRKSAGKGKKWWKNMMGVESLPSISHTFKFGKKEWTLKIGEPKKEGEGGEGGEGGVGGGMEEEDDGGDRDDDEGRRRLLQPVVPASAAAGGVGERVSLVHHAPAVVVAGGGGGGEGGGGGGLPPLPPPPPGVSSAVVGAGAAAAAAGAAGAGASSSSSLSPMRRMSSSTGRPTIDGSSTGGMGQWASVGEGEGEVGGGTGTPPLPLLPGEEQGQERKSQGEHVLLNVSQLRQQAADRRQLEQEQQQQQQQQQAVVALPALRGERKHGGGGVAEDKEEAHATSGEYREERTRTPSPPGTTTDDYGTFSPTTSPGGPSKKTTTEQHPDEKPSSSSSTTTTTTASGSIATVAATPPSSIRRSTNSQSNIAGTMSPATLAAQAPVIFKERWKQKEQRIRQRSPIGHLPRWRLLPVIVKANDDLRQEQFASQLLRQIDNILREAEIPVWMRPYDIIATSVDGGLIEAIPDTVSLDALRRNDPHYTTLPDFFDRLYGSRGGDSSLDKAKQCFIESLAAYSIVCFLLQIKDRHNGNILLDAEGHIIHIDFGFLLARSPGNVNFERAPFKLTAEFVEIMEGPRSPLFKKFRDLCVKTYMELRRQRHKIILLVEMVVSGHENLPCFGGKPQVAVEELRQRFQPELNDRACIEFVHGLIDQSLDNWRTRLYDRYQNFWVLR